MVGISNAQMPAQTWIQRLSARVCPGFWRNVGLGAKMATIVVIGLLSLIGLFAGLGTTALNENIQRTLQERVVLAQTAARSIDHILTDIENLLTDTATQCWLDPERTVVNLECAYRHLNLFATRVFLLDRTGRVVAAHPPAPATVSFGHFTSVSDVLNGQPFAVSPYRRPLDPLDPSPIATVSVRDEAGNITGALVVSLDLASPGTRLFTDPIGLGQSGYMDLVDLRGVILASTRPERVGRESDHGDSLAGMIRDHRQAVSTCHDCHTPLPDPAP